MKNILKTLAMMPVILVLGTLFYLVLFGVLFVSYFVGLLMLPTKLHGYLVKLDEYRRIQK